MADSTASRAADMAADTAAGLGRLLRPRSVAIVGISDGPASMGYRALLSLERFGYDGKIHLVNRNRREIDGRASVASIDELPMGVDAAIFSIPQAGVEETLKAAVARGIGGAVLFSAGYAEAGDEGRAAQDRLAQIARSGGLALAGPNCLGLVNYIASTPLTSGPVLPARDPSRPGLALLTQSGGMMGCLINASEARGLPLSYAISTGNEAVLGVIDYFEVVIEDDQCTGVAIFAEQLRDPARFLRLARRARDLGKPVILLHSGKSARAQEAAVSHTGAVASNFNAMKASVEAEGVIVVGGMDALIDVAELVTRFRTRPGTGAGIVTDSGAFKGLALDFAEDAGLKLPEIAPETDAALRDLLPAFVEPSNPLDLTGQAMSDIETFYMRTAQVLAADPGVDVLIVSQLPGKPEVVTAKAEAVARTAASVDIPVVCVFLGNGAPLPAEAQELLQEAGVPLFQSGEQAIRAVAALQAYATTATSGGAAPALGALPPLPRTTGALPEYEGKAWLAEAIGLPAPLGVLATSRDDAIAAAGKLGFPVAMKVQHPELMHKSDVGGVAIGLSDPKAVGTAWDRILANLDTAKPGHPVDGILVEAMGEKGVELVLGATRDPQWGPMLMVGLGGIWIELMQDVALMPAGTSAARIKQALLGLKGAGLLTGYRGTPPVDLDAVASLAERLGALMIAAPEIREIDLNPVIARPDGAEALDALVVLGPLEKG